MIVTNIVSISLPVDRFANVLAYPKVYKSQITRFCFLALTLTSFCQIFIDDVRRVYMLIFSLNSNFYYIPTNH
jgi:hypothetical protein